MRTWPPDALRGQTVVVTGATNGIGKETARLLAQLGARTILVGRDPDKGARVVRELQMDTGNLEIELLLADLALQRDVRRVAAEIRARCARLDVLVNNVGAVHQRREVTAEGFEQTWALNHLSYLLLTLEVLDLLRASAPARIVNVSSSGHRLGRINFQDVHAERGYRGFQRYLDTKLANILLTRALARRLAGLGVTVNAAHPGFVPENFPIPNSPMRSLGLKLAGPWSKTSRQGAQTSVYLATSMDVREVSGLSFEDSRVVTPARAALDAELAESLWTLSLRQVQETFPGTEP